MPMTDLSESCIRPNVGSSASRALSCSGVSHVFVVGWMLLLLSMG